MRVITTPTFGKFSDKPFEVLEKAGYQIDRVKAGATEQDVIDLLGPDTKAILTGLEPITEKVMSAGKGLAVIGKHGIGVDNIDLDAAKRLGIQVINTLGTNTEAVADLAFGLMLALARKIPQSHNAIVEGQWPKVFGVSVWDKTLGIIGFGAIGKKLALRAKGFNMDILAYDPYFDKEYAEENGITETSIEEILKQADFVSLHLPLTKETENLIGGEELKTMKSSAYIINTSRGGIVNEDAIRDALLEGTVAGAAFDVFVSEPMGSKELISLPNFIATPHMGAYTIEALDLTSYALAENIVAALNGEQLKCRII